MLFASLVISAILLAVVNAAAGTDGRRAGLGVAVAALAFGFFFFLAQALVLAGNALAVLIAALVCCSLKARPVWFFKASLLATALVYGIAAVFVSFDIRENLTAREQYPYESLAGPLQYESRGLAGVPPGNVSQTRLRDSEHEIDRYDYFGQVRTITLRHIHSNIVEQFINSPGFGVMRQIRAPGRYLLPARPADPVEQPGKVARQGHQVPGDAALTSGQLLARGLPDPLSQDQLLVMHDRGVADFVNPRGFGDAIDRHHVAGFQKHLFREVPDLRSPPGCRAWMVSQLDLVSLLKFDEPCAYVSEHLPRMDELRDAPTRPLDPFERDALTALGAGEDLRVEARPDRIRVLGAVRALKQCLSCHEAQRGSLLGAFSYVLRPDAGER